jgi:hypothetical protein
MRKRLKIKNGTRATWIEERGGLTPAPMTKRGIKEIQGFLE